MTHRAFDSIELGITQAEGVTPAPSTVAKAEIRPAGGQDIPGISEVLASSFYDPIRWAGLVYPLVKLGIQADLQSRIQSSRLNYICLAALVSPPSTGLPTKPTIAGTVELSQRHPWPWQTLEAPYGYVANLAVGYRFRRQGIGRNLLAVCETIAQGWQMGHLYLHVMENNRQARQLYSRAGFQLLEAEPRLAPWPGCQPRRLLMRKVLDGGLKS
jgi:ribosomal protein S18 acetylase RimI-like enzyme